MAFRTTNLRQSQRKKELKRVAGTALSAIGRGFSKAGSLFAKGMTKTVRFAENRIRFFEKKRKERKLRWFIGILLILFASVIVVGASMKIIRFLQDFQISDFLKMAGDELPKDEKDFTNILLIGVGGEGHDGEDLTDTLMIASIDESTKSIVMTSIPRDFYVETDLTAGRINEIIRDVMDISPELTEEEAYIRGLNILIREIEEVFQMKIHRYIQIDFKGFKNGVDAIGGVDILVEETIDDQSYPTSNWGYERFYLEAGNQHLDGEVALKYARSRHGNSDFSRAKRQREILTAILDKTISGEILTNPEKLKELYSIVDDNLKTDLSWREILTLAHVGYTFPRERMLSFGLNDDPSKSGGFLVTPERDLYGGAFVLVPYLNLESDKYKQIRVYYENITRFRKLHLGEITIAVENGTKTQGLAGEGAQHLERFGIPVRRIENAAEELAETEIRYYKTGETEEIVTFLQRFIVGKPVPVEPPPFSLLPSRNLASYPFPPNEIEIILGSDYEIIRRPEYSNDITLPETP